MLIKSGKIILSWLPAAVVCSLLFCLPVVAQEAVGHGFVRGRVTDKETGEPIPGANILVASTNYGAATDSAGWYMIPNLPSGPYTIGVKVIGYQHEQARVTIFAWDTIRQDFELVVEPIPLEQIIREGSRVVELEKEVQVSVQSLRGSELQAAGSAAQADLFRTIQTLPAVVQVSDFSSELYVRGGSPDQNLVLIDGATIYNPFHFSGYFGAFNSLGIESAELFAGGFPARYGGRASSVLDIKNKVGGREGYHGELNVNFLSASTLIEGPIPGGSFSLSGRRSFKEYLDLLNRSGLYGTTIPPYYFYDVQGKTVTNLTTSHRLILSGYWADDTMDNYREVRAPYSSDSMNNYLSGIRGYSRRRWARYSGLLESINELFTNYRSVFNLDADWGNRAGSVTWQYLPSQDFSVSAAYTASSFFSDLYITDNTLYPGIYRFDEGIEDRTAMADLVWAPSNRVQLRAGAQIKRLSMDYLLKSPEEKLVPQLFPVEEDFVQIEGERRAEEMAGYLESAVEIKENLLLNAGLRFTQYRVPESGATDQFSYNFQKYSHELRYFEPVTRNHLEPRLGVKYNPDEDNYFKFAWGWYYQDLFLIPLRSGSNITVLNLWFPLDGKYEPLKADHFIFGYNRYFNNGFSVSFDLYYKRLANFMDPSEAYIPDDPSSYFATGEGRVKGLELLIRRQGKNTFGWLGYSLSNSKFHNGDDSYDLWFDQRHKINFVLHWFSYDRRWETTLSWTFSSGLPYTRIIADALTLDLHGDSQPQQLYSYEYLPVNVQGQKHAWRYPPYHRMDLSVRREITKEPFLLYGSIWWVNLYNHRNIFFYRYQGAYTAPGKISMLPSVPFIGLEAKF